MIQVPFAKFELERCGLEAPPFFINIVFLLLNIFTAITFGGESLNGRLKLLVEGQCKMLVDFVVVIKVASIPRT
jgi:hypothetical protein